MSTLYTFHKPQLPVQRVLLAQQWYSGNSLNRVCLNLMHRRKAPFVWTHLGIRQSNQCISFLFVSRWMFDCCRVPGPQGLDWSVSHAKPGDAGDTGHIIVIRKNRFWKMEATDNGRILSTAEFERLVQFASYNDILIFHIQAAAAHI